MSPAQVARSVNDRLKDVSHITGSTSLIGLLFMIWLEYRQPQIQDQQQSIAALSAKQLELQNELDNITIKLQVLDTKLDALVRLACISNTNKVLGRVSGACP